MESEKQPLKIQNSSGNLKIPLANGNVMNIPLSAINISEEVNKSGVWKQVNETNTSDGKEKKKSPKSTRFVSYFNKFRKYKTEIERFLNVGRLIVIITEFVWVVYAFSRFKKKKLLKKEEKRDEKVKLEKRLSTCKEEEDEGITIKVTDTALHI